MTNSDFDKNYIKENLEIDCAIAEIKRKLQNNNTISNTDPVIFIQEDKEEQKTDTNREYEEIIYELKDKIIDIEREKQETQRLLKISIMDVQRLEAKIREIGSRDELKILKDENIKLKEIVCILKEDRQALKKNENERALNFLKIENDLDRQNEILSFKKESENLEKQRNLKMLENEKIQNLILINLQAEIEKLKEENQKLEKQGAAEIYSKQKEIDNLENEIVDYQNKILEKIKEIERVTFENKACSEEISYLKGHLEEADKRLKQLELQNKEHEKQQINKQKEINKLKNDIVDLKGNIRVYCRIRPNLRDASCKYSLTLNERTVSIEQSQFTFDRVFHPAEKQVEVYAEIEFLINSIFDGYNSCIFAYGQTGSGKTYTMEGNSEDLGIIPRAIHDVFKCRDELVKSGWRVKMIISYIEIYNENIQDLLAAVQETKYEIKHENGRTYIKNCNSLEVHTLAEAMDLLAFAGQNRSIGSTQCNNRSSRSHSVFILNIDMHHKENNEQRSGTLNLIDLAGSERLSESGSEGVRLRETQNINKSLSALGNVIASIIKKDPHVPFRDSKLTYLLKNNLTGKSRMLMLVNVSPELSHLNETFCSLRFAQKVSECKLGQVTKNIAKKL